MFVTLDAWQALGTGAAGERLARMERSAHYRDGQFVNELPPQALMWESTTKWLTGGGDHREPTVPVPVDARQAADFAEPPPDGLRLTWLGHSTMLVELDGHRFITDPQFARRESPTRFFGPDRFYAPPLALADLPDLDAVLISHDHYDHLEMDTVQALNQRQMRFVVPLGVGAHLEYWGVPAERIVELDWWEHTKVGSVELHCTPARHFSGRGVWDWAATLWAGWAIVGPDHRVFYSGDSAMFPTYAEIGARLGPFDATFLDTGAYDETWADYHMGPEQAVAAHRALRGKLLLPVHWGTFNLGLHNWTEPAERLLIAAAQAGVKVAIPRPGQSVSPASPPPVSRWWPNVPWQTANEHRIVSSGLGATAAPDRAAESSPR
ncbi:MAG: MBL fold metallo-hydrolase [Deltaproteobacteria bacterium]|nr:MBL fold metallo-hydrolase [Deltaproteobacteria bacterium]